MVMTLWFYEDVFVLRRYKLNLLGVKCCDIYNLLSNNSAKLVYKYKQMRQYGQNINNLKLEDGYTRVDCVLLSTCRF